MGSKEDEIIERVWGFTGGRETEVLVFTSETALTRFADNTISQNVAERSREIVIRVLDGEGRMGRVSLNHPGEAELRRACETAVGMLKMQKPDPELMPLSAPRPIPAAAAAFDEETAAYTPAARADRLVELAGACAAGKQLASGTLESGWSRFTVANSRGVRASHQETGATFSVTVKDGDGLGWAEEFSPKVGTLDFSEVGERAREKARLAKAPQAVEPGKYTVVLEPDPVANLLFYTGIYGFGGQFYLEGQSFMSGKLGEKLLGENISIEDNALEGPGAGVPFDFEGMPRRRVSLVECGVAKSPVHDRKTAKKAGTETTGHSLVQPNTYGPVPTCLAMAAGDASVEEMIRSTERGILVTQFHYVNLLKPLTLDITGMTRNGTFWIEDGKVVRPIKNLRFTESIVGALGRVEAVGRDRTLRKAFFGGKFLVPALKVRDFTFSSSTDF